MDDAMIRLVGEKTRENPIEALKFLKKMADSRGLDHQGYSIGIENVLKHPAFQDIEKVKELQSRNSVLENENEVLNKVIEKIAEKGAASAKKKEEVEEAAPKSPGRPKKE